MRIKHTHFKTLDSTQLYLINHYQAENGSERLITTEQQTAGFGRRGTAWEQSPTSLAMSFSCDPHDIFTLSSLQIGLMIRRFFKSKAKIELQLKWPNDLFFEEKKIGGIITQTLSSDPSKLAVGVGINFFQTNGYHSLPGLREDTAYHQKELALEIVEFILGQPQMESSALRAKFFKFCVHKNKQVGFEVPEGKFQGEFIGIGEMGQAQCKSGDKVFEVFSGSLSY